jgi:CheY-like chemotaxis protein
VARIGQAHPLREGKRDGSLALTGSVRESDHEDAERSGVDYVLHKPLDVTRLRRMLPRVC